MPFPPAPPEKKPSVWSLSTLKKYRLPILAASAMGGPVAYFESGEWTKGVTSTIKEWTSSSPAPSTPAPTTVAGSPPVSPYGGHSAKVNLINNPMPVSEVFNFDITPEWVASRWEEVSLGMADVSLTGHRVMLVTGGGPQDLAGSLTYYFDVDQRLQRIRFEGVTGDVRPLVAEMAMRHRFIRCANQVAGTEIFQVHYNGKATGEMRIRSSSVARAGSQLGRYSVSLSIDRPE